MRSQLLDGRCPLPSRNAFVTQIGQHYTRIAEHMFRALWHSYLRNKGSINSVYWSERFANPKVFNLVLMSLSSAGWLVSHSIPARNWAEMSLLEDKLLDYVSADELENIRAHNKFQQYILTDEPSTISTLTRLNGDTRDTGLVREGFMQAGNTLFQFDLDSLTENREVVQKNLTKSMDKIAEICPNLRHDRASYDTISIEILDYYMSEPRTYTRGNNYNDSRGRAISSALSKVGNPISNKDMRSLLVIPE